jgi:hypothetical protein
MAASPAKDEHVAMLTKFYAKHDSSKTAAQIQKLAAKHAGGGKFETLCGKMKQKYGESPKDMWDAVQMTAIASEPDAMEPEPEGSYLGGEGAGSLTQRNHIKMDALDVIDRMTASLYQDFKVFGREMVANGVDAYRWALHSFIKGEAEGGPSVEQQLKQWGVMLQVDIGIHSAKALSFEDYGCGMTKDVLENHYWAIAKSSKGEQ